MIRKRPIRLISILGRMDIHPSHRIAFDATCARRSHDDDDDDDEDVLGEVRAMTRRQCAWIRSMEDGRAMDEWMDGFMNE